MPPPASCAPILAQATIRPLPGKRLSISAVASRYVDLPAAGAEDSVQCVVFVDPGNDLGELRRWHVFRPRPPAAAARVVDRREQRLGGRGVDDHRRRMVAQRAQEIPYADGVAVAG